jgi:hypothetical protein
MWGGERGGVIVLASAAAKKNLGRFVGLPHLLLFNPIFKIEHFFLHPTCTTEAPPWAGK